MTVLSTSNKTWYKVKLTYKKKSYTGYVYSAFIKVTRTTSKKAHLRKNENYVYFRKTPNGTPLKYNGSPIMLMGGQSMTVLSTSNKTWYKVKLTYKKKRYDRLCIFQVHRDRLHFSHNKGHDQGYYAAAYHSGSGSQERLRE